MIKSKEVQISEKEMRFVEEILDGESPLGAYKKVYQNLYTDTKAKYQANQILKREHVIAYTQQLLIDRETKVSVDEPFILEQLRYIAMKFRDTKPTVAVNALKLLGQNKAMFADKQIIDTTIGHREAAGRIYAYKDALERGEIPEPLEDIVEDQKLIKFVIKNGTDDG